MIIRVEMINWRAFERRDIELGPGINFLTGLNGAGKTSVLEAISYALTGEAAMFNSKTRPKLLRDPEKSATVTLVFEIEDAQYEVRRTQSPKAAGDAQLVRLSDGKVLAATHTGVTKQISKIIGVSDDFLRRIIYMAEGDVFHFLNDPPGEALELQIRQVLGLTQLDQFTQAVDKAEKQLKRHMGSVQELTADLDRLLIKNETSLQEHLTAGEGVRTVLLEQLEDNKEQVIHLQRIQEEAGRLQSLLTQFQEEIERHPEQWQGFQTTPLAEYSQQIEQRIRETGKGGQEFALSIARHEGEKQSYQKTLLVLEPYENRSETLPCPVCQKPMTGPERQSVLSEIHVALLGLDQQIEALQTEQAKNEADLRALQRQTDLLHQLRNLIAHGHITDLKQENSYEQIVAAARKASEKKEYLGELERQRREIQQRISKLQTDQAAFIAIQKRLNDFGFERPEEVGETLVNMEIRLLSIRAASQAVESTLVVQRNLDLQSIYKQIAQLWGAFVGEDAWQVAMDASGMITLQNEMGRQFDLQQLSGGEKTALLIMLHTIIAHHFSRSNFLMIDEPLEHLDPVNRRSLIRFLVQCYRRGIFKQAIVATFEESLIRKYLSEDGVTVIII